MIYSVSIDYRKKIEQVRHFLRGLAYTERHPEPLTFEEVQQYDGNLLSSVWIENVRDEYFSQKNNFVIFKEIFSDILDDWLVRSGTAAKWRESEESLLYDKSAVVKRLEREGNTQKQIIFYLSQVYKLQQTVLERMDAVRVLIDKIGVDEQPVTANVYPIKLTQLFSSPDKCAEFFADSNTLSCAQWARRLFEYERNGSFYFTVNGDYKTVYDEIKNRHPNIASIKTFYGTLRNLKK